MQNISAIMDYAFLSGYMKKKKKIPLWKYDDEFMGLKLWGSFYSSKNRGRGGEKSPIWMAYITITHVLCLYFS